MVSWCLQWTMGVGFFGIDIQTNIIEDSMVRL